MQGTKKSEDTEQGTVIDWARVNERNYPELKWLYHCPNGGSRNYFEAVKLKEMGVKAGVADLCLPYPRGIYCGMYIEMKYGNNRCTDLQKEFLADMELAGHFVVTCYSSEDAIKALEEYLKMEKVPCGEEYVKLLELFEIKPEEGKERMQIPNNCILKDGKVKGIKK